MLWAIVNGVFTATAWLAMYKCMVLLRRNRGVLAAIRAAEVRARIAGKGGDLRALLEVIAEDDGPDGSRPAVPADTRD